MAKKIAILNFKGGVGKTTTAVNICAALAIMKKRTLLIDMDGQCNATFILDYHVGDGLTLYDSLADETLSTPLPIYEYRKNFDFVPASIQLRKVSDRTLVNTLDYLIQQEEADYDYIIIDCPPGDGILNDNAMAAVQDVIIPCDGDELSMQGVSTLLARINQFRKLSNKTLNQPHFLMTKFDQRLRLHKDSARELRETFPQQVLNARIRTNARLRETPSAHQTIFEYDPTSSGATDYMQLAKEIIKTGI